MDVSDVAEPTAPPARVRKFDRPRHPRDWRWWIGGLGKTLIAAGLLMFGFVAYQLWGTGIETARAQNALENQFEDILATTTTATTTTTTATVATTEPTVDVAPLTTGIPPPTTAPVEPISRPIVEEGDPIARLEMPSIGVDNIVVAGVSKSDLKKGPGHYPETPLPGQLGNAAIAGHRTTYGQPFYDVDKLVIGDEIVMTTLDGRFVYRVTGQQIVSPSDYQVVATVDPTRATLTLTSCHPKYTARQRIIITSELNEAASSGPAGAALINYGRPLESETREIDPTNAVGATLPSEAVPDDSAPGDSTPEGATPGDSIPDDGVDAAVGDDAAGAQPGSEAVNSEIADAFSDGWFSDPSANAQVALWGLLLAAVGALSYLVSKRAKRDWVGLTVGIVPFVIVLYFFFQNVNRLLPPNL